jgi:hypothetical protein
MRSVRARLGVYAIALLVCQGAALAVAPATACRMLAAEAMDDGDECCKHLGPGQTCPMHRKSDGAPERRGPAWNCVCTPGDAALISLLGVSGTMSAPVTTIHAAVPVDAVVSPSSCLHDRSQPPRAPPPRA